MRYPTLDRSSSSTLLEQLLAGNAPPVDPAATWVGSGEDIDLRHLELALAPHRLELETALAEGRKLDVERFEGALAGVTHAALRDVPPVVLDDRGFWRYLALKWYWWFIEWREARPLAEGRGLTYVDAQLAVMAIPTRLFLRGQAVERDGDYSPAGSLSRSTDFWRSHVLRVKVGTAPPLTRSLVGLQQERTMSTDHLRAFARSLNRTWSNVVLNVYDERDARQLLDELFVASAGGQLGPDDEVDE